MGVEKERQKKGRIHFIKHVNMEKKNKMHGTRCNGGGRDICGENAGWSGD